MPSATTNGLPYPLGSDPVADGDDAIKNLAQALDPAWTALTLLSGFIARAGAYVPGFRVIAGHVFLRGQVQRSSGVFTVGDAPFTVPAAGRPPVPVRVALSASRASGTSSPTGALDVFVAGTTTVYPDTNVSNWISLDGVSYYRGA